MDVLEQVHLPQDGNCISRSVGVWYCRHHIVPYKCPLPLAISAQNVKGCLYSTLWCLSGVTKGVRWSIAPDTFLGGGVKGCLLKENCKYFSKLQILLKILFKTSSRSFEPHYHTQWWTSWESDSLCGGGEVLGIWPSRTPAIFTIMLPPVATL